MKGSIKRYCTCKNPVTGRQYGAQCPALLAETKHGEWNFRTRLPTSDGQRELRRRGFTTRKLAGEFRDRVSELLALAQGDESTAMRLGDLVFERTRHSGQLPDVADVRRRLGLGSVLGRSQPTGEWLAEWIGGKRRLRTSSARGYQQHIDQYLVPILGQIPLDRLSAEQISDMFDLIEEWNDEIARCKIKGGEPILPGDVRARSRHVGIATQRRVFATLRNALNSAWKARRIDGNPCFFVEMPPEYRDPARVWSPVQVTTFLDASMADRLHLLYRLVLLRGLRRGEATGLRWADIDLDHRELRVTRPLLSIGGKLITSTPKTRAGERTVILDEESASMLKRHRTTQRRERMAWGGAYTDNDLAFAQEDGSYVRPDYVSRRFQVLTVEAGLPVITLHMGRHTAASLALEAGVDIKVVSEQLGHSTTAITQNLYQHVRRAVHDGAAEAVVRLLPERKPSEDIG